MADIGLLKLLFLTSNLLFWLVGVGLLGFVGWTLSTLPNTSEFMSGSFLTLYAGIGVGFLISIDGLLGCLGGLFGSMLFLKLYIGCSVLFGIVEVVLILEAYVQKDEIPSILESTWNQINNEAKYIIQKNLKCCGIKSYTEYGTDYAKFPDSCFKTSEMFNSVLDKSHSTLYTTSCLSAIQTWLSDNMAIWIAALVGIGLIQICSGMLSCQVFTRLHARCKIKPTNINKNKEEESGELTDDIQSNFVEENKSERNIPIDGASYSSPTPTEQTHKNTRPIAMVNLDSTENDHEYMKETMADKIINDQMDSDLRKPITDHDHEIMPDFIQKSHEHLEENTNNHSQTIKTAKENGDKIVVIEEITPAHKDIPNHNVGYKSQTSTEQTHKNTGVIAMVNLDSTENDHEYTKEAFNDKNVDDQMNSDLRKPITEHDQEIICGSIHKSHEHVEDNAKDQRQTNNIANENVGERDLIKATSPAYKDERTNTDDSEFSVTIAPFTNNS